MALPKPAGVDSGDGLFAMPAVSAPARQAASLTLLRLRLRNFKGIQEFELDTAGGDVSVWGDNGTGKTTLFDGFLWLLFNKDSENKTDFEVKALTPEGEALHGLEHEVEGTFLFNGRTVKLRKVYSETWTKKRGSAEKQFTGHTTEYFVDGVPVSKGEYERRIAGIVDEKVFRLLSDPSYFNEVLSWQDRRRILLEVCGDISDADVIATDPKLADLTGILGDRALDDHRKVIQASRVKINKELEQIPVRISEVERNLPDVGSLDPALLAEDLNKARAARQAKAEELARAENGGAWLDKQNRLSAVRARLLEIESEHRNRAANAAFEKRRRAQEAQYAADAAKRDLDRLNADIPEKEREAARLGALLQELRDRWDQVDAEEFQAGGEPTVCPTCGQNLPAAMIEAARERALEAFNLSKSSRLEQITAEGKQTKQQKERLDAEVNRLKSNAEAAQEQLKKAQAEAARLQSELEKLQQPGVDTVARDPEHQRLAAERDQLTDAIQRLKAGAQADLAAIRGEIDRWDQVVASLEKQAADLRQHEAGMRRIEELRAEEKRLAAEYERLERELYLCDEFVRTKVRLLTDRINSRFQLARFRLFEEQVNGGLAETCVTTFNGVPYKNLNHGSRLNVGIDILNTLSDHYGFRAPVFVDNAESVTSILPARGQMVKLVVSRRDKSLRIEREAV